MLCNFFKYIFSTQQGKIATRIETTNSLTSLSCSFKFNSNAFCPSQCHLLLGYSQLKILGVHLRDNFLSFFRAERARLRLHFLHGSLARRKLWRALKDAIGPVLLPVCFEQRVGIRATRVQVFPVKRQWTKAPDKRHQKQHFVQVASVERTFFSKGLSAQKLPRPTVKSELVFTAGAVKEKERSAPRCFLERLLLDVSRKRLPLGHVRLECMLSQNTRL